MPNKNVHVPVGLVAGGGAALYMSRGQELPNRALEVIGGCVTGAVFAGLPDAIDPPTSPNHRSVGHAVLPAGVTAAVLKDVVADVQAFLRDAAAAREDRGRYSQDGFERFANALLALSLRLLAGAVPALVATYLAHLAVDATTKKSLPLLG